MALFRDLDLPNPELMRNRAFVAGNWVEAKSADRITVTDPFDGRDIADVPSLAIDTVRHAIDSAEGAIASKFRNTAQTYVCADSLCVQEGTWPEFSRALSKRVAHVKLGNGSDPETTQGPLIDQKAVAKIEEPIEDAVWSPGARLSSPAGAGARQVEAFSSQPS